MKEIYDTHENHTSLYPQDKIPFPKVAELERNHLALMSIDLKSNLKANLKLHQNALFALQVHMYGGCSRDRGIRNSVIVSQISTRSRGRSENPRI